MLRIRMEDSRLPRGMSAWLVAAMLAAVTACAVRETREPKVSAVAPVETKSPAPIQRSDYYPLQQGSYWLYEVSDSWRSATAYLQVLVTDEAPAADAPGATDIILSIIDHSIPREERPDEPTIIRQSLTGLECLDCGGLFLPTHIEDETSWSGGPAGQVPACRLTKSGLVYPLPDGGNSPTVIVSCSNPLTGLSVTRVYAQRIGPVLSIVSGSDAGRGVVRVERLREHRVLGPADPFPLLP